MLISYYLEKGLYPISSGKLWVLNSSPNIQFQAIIRSSYYIFYHFSTLRWCRYLKSFIMEDKDLFILQPISLQLMIWRSKKPGHKQPLYWHRALIQYKVTIYYCYRKSHCGDKTILRPSCLHNGISYIGKMASLYWISALVLHILFMEQE